MRIEHIHIKNFRALYDVELSINSPMAVFFGGNGSGKSTLFSVFGFLKDALQHDVTTALQNMGGYHEVVTRGHGREPIVIQIQFRMDIAGVNRLVTYGLEISTDEQNSPFIQLEFMEDTGAAGECPHRFLEFRKGTGYAAGEIPEMPPPSLTAPDILAIKGLGQIQSFKEVSTFHDLIEKWYISDFHIAAARQPGKIGNTAHLSTSGGNLSQVAYHLHEKRPEAFNRIVEEFKYYIPDMPEVTTKVTEDKRVLLRFGDKAFKDPFSADHVSDGTIKLFAFMVLLHDPEPHPFMCIEEPENQLYPGILAELAEALRGYARRGGQVFVSTHSPDFLNYVEADEAFFLKKQNSVTEIYPISQNKTIKNMMKKGDTIEEGGNQLGWLWLQCEKWLWHLCERDR